MTSTENPKAIARLTGLSYLILAAIGMFAFMFVFEPRLVRGDAVATAANIREAEQLVRFGVAGYFVTLFVDVLIAWLLFRLLAPAGIQLSRLAAWLRLLYVAIHGAALMPLLDMLRYLRMENAAQVDFLIGDALAAQSLGFGISLFFFGAHLIVVGLLILRSNYLPGVLGWLLMLAAFAYMTDATAMIVLSDYDALANTILPFVAVPAIIGEFSLLLWLLVRGVNAEKWRQQSEFGQ